MRFPILKDFLVITQNTQIIYLYNIAAKIYFKDFLL